MQSTPEAALPDAACSRISTTRQLRQAQELLARFASGPTATQELPLTAAAGRILARDVALKTADHEGLLGTGTKLDWRVLPLLHALGRSTVPVHAPVRCGIVVIDKKTAQPAALLVQAAVEKTGGQAFLAWTDGASSQQTSALQMFSKFCDLILVVGAPGCPGSLCAPRVFTVANSVCVDLPADAQAALGSFVSFVIPLVRRLQGRRTVLPAQIHSAVDEGVPAIGGELVWVTARGEGAGLRVRSRQPEPGLALQGLAEVSGVAWKAEDLAGAVAYMPFGAWLD